jgi:Ca2+-binding RTX toxin-like protein
MRALKLIRTVFAVVGTMAATAAGAYAGALLSPFHGAQPAGSAQAGAACGGSARVGYEVRYDAGRAGYVVSGVRLLGTAPSCAGDDAAVALGNADGELIDGGWAAGTVAAGETLLPLDAPVLAKDVGTLAVALSSAPAAPDDVPADPPPVKATAPPQTVTIANAPPCPHGTRIGRRVVGTSANDCLFGTAGPDVLAGLAGSDLLVGAAGNDRLEGGPGDDHLSGGAGNDKLYGGPGDDHLDGGPGQDVCVGGGGHDTYDSCEKIVRPL